MAKETASTPQDRRVRVGERIVGQLSLSLEEIATFARLSGDLNPLHHDEDYARRTRFGGVIACGPQLTSVMMGLTATYFSQGRVMLGLEFTFRFRKAALAGDTIDIVWEVVSVEPKAVSPFAPSRAWPPAMASQRRPRSFMIVLARIPIALRHGRKRPSFRLYNSS